MVPVPVQHRPAHVLPVHCNSDKNKLTWQKRANCLSNQAGIVILNACLIVEARAHTPLHPPPCQSDGQTDGPWQRVHHPVPSLQPLVHTGDESLKKAGTIAASRAQNVKGQREHARWRRLTEFLKTPDSMQDGRDVDDGDDGGPFSLNPTTSDRLEWQLALSQVKLTFFLVPFIVHDNDYDDDVYIQVRTLNRLSARMKRSTEIPLYITTTQ
ncbi:hypothetical protein CBL_05992 [Carabus blaptoides fortunei]